MIRSFILFLLVCVGAPPAFAQFPGDVFFETPVVSVPNGQTADLRLSIFTGASPFGIAQVNLTYDPALLTLESTVLPSVSGENGLDLIVENAAPGQIKAIVVNGASLIQPTGIVGLVDLRFRATASATAVARINASLVASHQANTVLFPNQNALGAEIVIGPPSSAAQALKSQDAARSLEVTSGPLYDRALRLRPIGTKIQLYDPSRRSVVSVVTRDPAAPSD